MLGGVSLVRAKTEFDSVPSGLVVVPRTNIDYVVAPTVGLEVPVMIGSHFSLVPALQMSPFTLRTDGTNGVAIRPGLAFRWIS